MSDNHEKTDADGYALDELLFFADHDIERALVLIKEGNLGAAHQFLQFAAKSVARAMALKECNDG